MLGVADDQSRAAVCHLQRQHAGALLDVERHDGQARSQRTIEQRDVLGAVAKQQRHAVAGFETGRTQHHGGGRSAADEIAIGPLGMLPAQRHLVGVARSCRQQEIYEGIRHVVAGRRVQATLRFDSTKAAMRLTESRFSGTISSSLTVTPSCSSMNMMISSMPVESTMPRPSSESSSPRALASLVKR